MSDDSDIRAQGRVGTVLNDKWTLERLLGIGGMAAVYCARHRNGARAAVKVLHTDLSRRADVRERFLREGYAANSVGHPGVVRVLDDDVVAGGLDAGTAYLVMELLDGESLQDRLDRAPPMGEREFLAIVESVLDVLQAAHARGVIHRDLKPENLFLMGEPEEGDASKPRVKVLDFGLARLLQEQTITSYGLALGTPSFMSPEQAAGRIDEIDGRTDLFALAATGFRLRTGRRIHEGTNPVELVTKMAYLPAPRIRTLAEDTSEPFARVIDRALEFRRDDRYESASAMRDDVRKAIAELDAWSAATRLAAHALPLSAPRPEATIQLGESDLEHSPWPPESPPKPAGSLEFVDREKPGAGPEESIKIPLRRSLLPWLALVVIVGIGAKLWIDSRYATRASGEVRGDESVAADGGFFPADAAEPRDAGTDVVPFAVHSAILAPSAAPRPQPAPATIRRPTPINLGPGNVHKVPGTYNAH